MSESEYLTVSVSESHSHTFAIARRDAVSLGHGANDLDDLVQRVDPANGVVIRHSYTHTERQTERQTEREMQKSGLIYT